VVTLADICDGLGDHVTEAAWLGHRDTDRPHYYCMNGQLKGIPAAAIVPYGARLLYKHLMYQITLALYRWHWAHPQTRRILDNGFTLTQTIDCIADQHQTRGNSALGTLTDSATTSLRFNCSSF
jgi:hypothetical protein